MENCIKPVLGVSQEVLKKNQIRKSICTFFSQRDCFTLIRPLDDEDQLASLEDLEYPQLKDEFREECDTLIHTVRQDLEPKKLHGKELNSQMLLGLAMDFCESINSAEAPKIKSSVDRLISEEVRVIEDESFNEFKL